MLRTNTTATARARANARATAQWRVEGLHPTLPAPPAKLAGTPIRKDAKDGAPVLFGCPKENKDNSRSLRDDNKKGNNKGKGDSRSPLGMTARKAKATATAKATAGPSTSLRMTGFGDGDRGDGDRYGTTTENSRFLHCAAHDETVSSFGRNDDLFRVGASRGAELGASILLLRPGRVLPVAVVVLR